MSKIYRLHTGAIDTLQDWTQISSHLDAAAINNIKDAAGGNAKKQITSIPSPFARIDLIKTAFRNVTTSGSPEGLSIYHKMVSDTLDVGQVFFNSMSLDKKIELISWNPGLSWVGGQMVVNEHSDLWDLLHKGSENHKLYGETLRMFFSQDAAEYNFDLLKQFYLLHYTDGKGRLNILGGTSPATLFFSTANNLDYVQLHFANDKLFDETYCPLPERNEDYILFLYALREAMPGFSTRFTVVDDYLELCLKHLPTAIRNKVIALDSGSYERNYNSITLAGTGNHPEIAGFELRGIRLDHERPQEESDFVIAATKQPGGLLPLVLPAYTFTSNMRYVDGVWPAQLKVPHFDPLPLSSRTLPGQMIQYPYLTTSDFLEPYLVQLPFEPNSDRFFTGDFPKGRQEGFLLPLSQAFFNYFSTADLQQIFPDGRRMFTLESLPGNAVKAKLHIPVKNGRYIDMERIYETDKARVGHTEPALLHNRGIIKDQRLSVAIYPFVKRGTDDQAAYTIMLLNHDEARGGTVPYKLKYYKDSDPQRAINPVTQRQKSNKQEDMIDTLYDVVSEEFDFMAIENGRTRGCLIPLFKTKHSNNRQYSFAIDFGTTNTHIEYSVDNGPSQPLDITAEDQQLGTLHTETDDTYNHLTAARFGKGATLLLQTVSKELMPPLIGPREKYRFPRRTVVSEPVNIDPVKTTYPLADYSIYWQYDNGIRARQLLAHTNLKWGSLIDNRIVKRIEGYIANLVLLVRNKVVLNGGDLSKTKIVWFYPTSMSEGRLQYFEQIWDKAIEKYIGNGIAVTHIPESVAPFYFFRNDHGVIAGDQPVINIDIGGGTTDVVVYKNEQIVSYTSFKFAGNALFGDGYSSQPAANGFVQFFEQQHRGILQDTLLSQYLPGKQDIDRSEEFITALFGLENHPDRGDVSFSFTQKLFETDELKIVPLFFISSILYHVAKYVQSQNGSLPRYITFSGTASKMLRILDVSKKLRSVSKLANQIFNDVFAVTTANIELVAADGPKEVTAKGGLKNPVVPELAKSVWFGIEEETDKTSLSYAEASGEDVRKAVIKEVSHFIDLFFSWNSKIDFTNEFALSTQRFPLFKKVLKADLDIFLVEGIYELKAEMNRQEDSPVKETLFFMPLRGVLNKLAFCIIDNNQ